MVSTAAAVRRVFVRRQRLANSEWVEQEREERVMQEKPSVPAPEIATYAVEELSLPVVLAFVSSLDP